MIIEDIRRKILRWATLVSSVQQEKDLREAAAALERLRALADEIERLREENRKLRAALFIEVGPAGGLMP